MRSNYLLFLISFSFFIEYSIANNCLTIYQQKTPIIEQQSLESILYNQFKKNPNSNALLLLNNAFDSYFSEIYKKHQNLMDTIETYGSENHLVSVQSLWQHSLESIKNYTSFPSHNNQSPQDLMKALTEDKILEKCFKNSEHCKTILSFGVSHYENLLKQAIQLEKEINSALEQTSTVNQNSFFLNSLPDPTEKKILESSIDSKITYLRQLANQMDSIQKLLLNKINMAHEEFKQINDLRGFLEDSNKQKSNLLEALNKQNRNKINLKSRTPIGIFIAGFIRKYYDKNFHELFFRDFITTFNRHFHGVLSEISIADFIEINMLLIEKEIYFSGNKLNSTQTKMIHFENNGSTLSINFPKEMYPLITSHPIVNDSKKLQFSLPTQAVAKLDLILSNFFLLLPAVKFELHSNEKTYDFLFSVLSELIKTELAKKSFKERHLSLPDEIIVGKFLLSQVDLMRTRFKLDLLINQRNILRGKRSLAIPLPFDGYNFEYTLVFNKSPVRVASKIFTELSNEKLQDLLFTGPQFKTISFLEFMKANGDPENRKKQLQSLFDSNTEFVVLTEVPHSFFMLSKKKNSLLNFPQFSSALNIELNSIRTPYIDNNAYSRSTYDIIFSRNKERHKNQYNLEYIDFHR